MNLTCERCGAEFEPRRTNRANRFCSAACYNASGRPRRRQTTTGPRMQRVPGHPIAPPSGTVAESRLVLFDKIGPGSHSCRWCDKSVAWRPGDRDAPDALVVDHLDWNQQNNDPANLVPSCRVCNAHRVQGGGRAPIEEGELYVTVPNGSRHRATRKPCEYCGDEFIAILGQVRSGKGRFCSRSCARRAPRTS